MKYSIDHEELLRTSYTATEGHFTVYGDYIGTIGFLFFFCVCFFSYSLCFMLVSGVLLLSLSLSYVPPLLGEHVYPL